MPETTEHVAVRTSPLEETHERSGAMMIEEDGWRLPSSYGEGAAEYEAVRGGGAGLIDFHARGRIEVSGSEAEQFLNGLVTNDVKALEEGAWMRAAFPNPQGRLVAEVRVLRLARERFLFDTERATYERVLQTLNRFTLAGDFHVRDLTPVTVMLSVQGSAASDVVRNALGEDASKLARGRVHAARWNSEPLYLIRATHTMEDGFDLFVSTQDAVAVWDAFAQAGARAVGHDALEVLRIEAGLARYGPDMDETNVVLEALLDDAVSFTKGCYTGQEIIARIHWRGHVAKKLTGLKTPAAVEMKRGDRLKSADGKEIGRVTSAAFSRILNEWVALGYVKYDYLAAGTRVVVVSGEAETEAEIRDLPHVRGSWLNALDERSAG